jgi:uncharacterized membrane protein YbhN (UPF0104 family)
MQYSTIPNVIKKPSNGFWMKTLKWAVFVCLLAYVYVKVSSEESFGLQFWLQCQLIFSSNSFFAFSVPFLLLPLNWGLEAAKWKLLLKKAGGINWLESWRAVLSGLSLGLLTHRIAGDVAARVVLLTKDSRRKSVGALLVSQLTQTFATYFCGSIGFIFALSLRDQFTYTWWLLPLSLAVALWLLLYLLRYKPQIFRKSKYLRWFSRFFIIIRIYTVRELLTAVLLSVLRYAVFTFQFIWVLKLCGLELPWQVLFAGVSGVFLAKTILPSLGFWTELGIRGGSALFFFSFYGVSEADILLGSLLIWLINVLFPALLGGIFILKLKV